MHSIGGNSSWYNNTDWLSFEVHECFWPHWVQTNIKADGRTYDYLPFVWPDMSALPCRNASNLEQEWQYERLWLANNGLSGTIPEEILLLTNLLDVNLFWGLNIIGTLPEKAISHLSKLTGLDMTGTGLSAPIPSEIGLLTDLKGT